MIGRITDSPIRVRRITDSLIFQKTIDRCFINLYEILFHYRLETY